MYAHVLSKVALVSHEIVPLAPALTLFSSHFASVIDLYSSAYMVLKEFSGADRVPHQTKRCSVRGAAGRCCRQGKKRTPGGITAWAELPRRHPLFQLLLQQSRQ